MVPKLPPQEICPDFSQTPVSVVPGAIYRFKGLRAPDKPDRPPMYVYPPADYRLIGVGRDIVTWQERCCFHLASSDSELFFCSLWYWADNFTIVADPAPGEKEVDLTQKGRGC